MAYKKKIYLNLFDSINNIGILRKIYLVKTC